MSMSTKTHRSKSERLGRWLGGMWRAYARREREGEAWLTAQGVPAGGTAALLWAVKLAALGVLFYVAGWLALLMVLAVAATWVAGGMGQHESTTWAIGDQADHKKSVFYDPRNYNDDPDPRFDDEQ